MSGYIAFAVIVRFKCERTRFASHIKRICAEKLKFEDVL